VVRADGLDRLTPAGWAAVWDYGVRTIIDLRRTDERAANVVRPPGLTVHRVSWDEYPDADWNSHNPSPGLPGSMRTFVQDYPQAVADTARLLINAEPGAVLVHCVGGRDRTGLFAIVLGSLAGVTPKALLDDYQHSFARLIPLYRLLGLQEDIDFVESEAKAEHRARVAALVGAFIEELDTEAAGKVLLDGGLSEDELRAVRELLTGHRGPGRTSPVS
jgi:protein tyrosine/serine phosphatase